MIREILESVTVDQGLKLLETVPGLREKVMEQVVRRAWEHMALPCRGVYEDRMYFVYQ